MVLLMVVLTLLRLVLVCRRVVVPTGCIAAHLTGWLMGHLLVLSKGHALRARNARWAHLLLLLGLLLHLLDHLGW